MHTDNTVISADSRKWTSARQNAGKSRVVTTFDAGRERALIMARIYIQREDLLTGDMSEQCYLAELCRYISEFDFNAEILRVTETNFAIVLAQGHQLTTQIGLTHRRHGETA